MIIVECIYCEKLYVTDWPCWTCFQYHCRQCSCKRWKFADDDLIFKPLFYAPKSFKAITTKEETETSEKPSPKETNPALWGAGFTSVFLATLWYWSTQKAKRSPSTLVVPQFITTYERG